MSQWVNLEPLSAAVETGDSAVVDLRIRNAGDIVEEYRVEVVGDPAVWCVVEPATIRLYPGTTGEVTLTFSPPRASDSAAGPHPYGVRVTPVENPEDVMVPEGTLTVASFVDVRAEMLPPTVRGWRRARPRLVVSNYGNALATASVSASGPGNRVDIDIRKPSLQIQPGRAHFSVLRMRPERLLWFGQKVNHPYTTTLQVSGRQPVTAAGAYNQTALLPRWLGGLFAVLASVVILFAGLWLAFRPSVATNATAQVALAGVPTVDVPTASSTPPPSQKPVIVSPPPASTSAPPSTSSAPAASSTSKPAAKPSTQQAPPPVTVPTPIANWILNQTTGNTAIDSTTVHNGAASNGWWAGTSCLFNGKNSQIVTTGPVVDTSPTGSFTILADVYLAAADTPAEQTMVSQDASQNSGFYLQYMGNSPDSPTGVWAFSRVSVDGPNPTAYRAYSTAKAAATTWTRLAGVYDAGTKQMQLYVNGQLQQTVSDPTPYVSNGPLAMGRAQYYGNATDWFNGALSNVEVFNQPLTAAQINAVPVANH
ncbi:LamG domain-containing protein [Catenulispora pinisilvae]|uniref:LamG domain-containing protein n=1 Tax=Catenulispora pinisilvae TaxID=2705253 RepID=UPI001890EF51|nr:LamG domain-containing protein [Catenulispora pinisilvae]